MLGKVFRRLFITFIILSQFLAPAATVSAVSTLPAQYETKFSQNNIVFYHPGNFQEKCGSGDISIGGDTIEEMIWSGLTSFMTEEQAAGVMGNMTHESNAFNPVQHEIENGGHKKHPNMDLFSHPEISYGIGLVQWSFGRRINLMNYINSNGPALLKYFNDYETYSKEYTINGEKFLTLAGKQDTANLVSMELSFLRDELTTKASYKGIFDQTTVKDATEFFLKHVEIPKNADSLLARRSADAQAFYDKYAGSGPGEPIEGCEDNTTLGNSLAEVAVKLAWPNSDGTCDDGGDIINWQSYKTRCYDDIKPAYKEAMEKLEGSKPLSYYQDCGHFASTVIRSSGADPDFPSSGTSWMQHYLFSHPDKWEQVDNKGNTSNLEAGDVFVKSGHIMIYTGNVSSYGNNASASQGERTGNMGNIYFSSFNIFRLKKADTEEKEES